MGELVWSLAGTHCVWCGKPSATDAELSRHAELECDEPCWCAGFCWGGCCVDVEERLGELRALVEAQAAVITRFRDGWNPRLVAPKVAHGLRSADEPMSDADQAAVWGRVVTDDQPAPADDGDDGCLSCPEGIPKGECDESERPCGHHCDCTWTHDSCHWCGEVVRTEEADTDGT